MKGRIKKLLFSNFLLKVVGVLLAVILWLVLSNMQDPLVSSSVTVPIIYDESGLESDNLVAISKPASVTIPVKVRKSKLRYLSAADFSVTANLSEVYGDVKEAPESTKVLLEISRSSSAGYIQEWEYPQSQNFVRVVFDTLKTAVYAVQFATTRELPEGYQLGELASTPGRVTVSGPTSEFANLASVKAQVDLSELSETNTTIEAALGLYDGNNRLLSASALTLSRDSVEVSVGLNQTKEISVSISSYSGAPAAGYKVSKIDYTPKLINISGTKNALAGISTISIRSDQLDMTGANETRSFNLDISSYLPEDISLAEGQSKDVTVTIEVEQLETRTFTISTAGFSFADENEKYNYSIADKNTEITVSAFSADLDNFQKEFAENIKGVINVGGMAEGDYMSVPVSITLDSAYVLNDEVTVPISISSKEEKKQGN